MAMFELTEESCLADKNEMLNLIHVTDENTFLENCQQLINFLSTSAHLWQRINYSYKAKELAQQLRQRCDEILDATKNWKRRNKVEALKMDAWRLVDQYHGLQMNAMALGGC